MPAITAAAVLGALNNDCRTIWDLASTFQVSAADAGLKAAVRELLDAGVVTATTANLFSATLTVVAHSPTT